MIKYWETKRSTIEIQGFIHRIQQHISGNPEVHNRKLESNPSIKEFEKMPEE